MSAADCPFCLCCPTYPHPPESATLHEREKYCGLILVVILASSGALLNLLFSFICISKCWLVLSYFSHRCSPACAPCDPHGTTIPLLGRRYDCTPARAALMTGKYPIKIGMQHECVTPTAEWGLKKSETTVRVEIVVFLCVAWGGSPVRLSGHLEPKEFRDHLEEPTLPLLLLLSLALIACLPACFTD